MLSTALGLAVVRQVLGPAGKAWAPALLQLSLALGLGMGLSSVIYFWVRMALGPSSFAPITVEIVTVIGLGMLAFKRNNPSPKAPRFRFAGIWILLPLVAMCAVAAGMLFVESVQASPYGHWDAWGTWNVRAEFLAENSGLWNRAFSPPARASSRFAGAMHPEYPPMLSAFVGRTWNYAASRSTDVPAIAAGAFTFALLGLLVAGLAILRGTTAGLLGAILFFGSTSLVDQSVSLIADIPLAFFLLAAIVSAMLATRYGDNLLALSGLAAGLGAWTKNEGLALAIGFGAAVVILMRKRSLWWLVGVAPVLIASACFKLLLTPSDPLLGAASKIAHLMDPSRYGFILGGFWTAFLNMGDGLAHPAVALILVAIGLGFQFDTKLRPAWIAGVMVVLVACASDFAAYLISPFDLRWHVSASIDRLIVQVWPTVILLVISVLQPPGEIVTTVEAKAMVKPRARRRTRSR